MVRQFLEGDVIRDEVFIQVVQGPLFPTSINLEKVAVGEGGDIQVGQDLALGIEETGVAPFPPLEPIDVVAEHAVQKPDPLRAGHAYEGPEGKVDEADPFSDGPMSFD